MEQLLRRLLPVASVAEEETRPGTELREAPSGCFSSGSKDHTTPGCQVLNESFPFLPAGWQADRQDNEVVLRSPRKGADDPPAENVA